MIKRILLNTDKRCLYKVIYNLGIKGSLSLYRYQKRLGRGRFFPAFHFISVTDDCNLRCQGCWVTGKMEKNRLDFEHVDGIIRESKAMGSYFFGILGGEPLLYKNLFDIFRKHPDCYFQLFTNGTLLTADVAEDLRRCANVTPLISFEGDEQVADIRRGGKDIYNRTQKAVENASSAGLFTGVAISVCKSNIEMALSPDFINSLIKKNVAYLWYYIFRPVGDNPSVELSLSTEDINRLRRFIVDARSRFDIAIIDAYWDEDGNGLCPAASGLSHHINASGYIEPCPVIQFATDKTGNKSLSELYDSSLFLKELRREIPGRTSGCVLMEDPSWVADMAEKYGAADTSGRNNETERLRRMPSVPSHGSAEIIPEKSRIYRFAKRKAFFGLGAYG
ncbi:MAG: radical SAM protein [Prolixibacteraceae bacterium]|nr:radical SAM protein [Prolixibacteraceae bacterium]